MGLGAGESKIYATNVVSSPLLTSIGFENSKGQKGIIVVNESANTQVVQVSTPGLAGVTVGTLYRSSQVDDGAIALQTIPVNVSSSTPIWNFSLPPFSVAGIIAN
jgi:hypothetical protein